MGIIMRIISIILTFISLIGSIFNPIDVYDEIESKFSDSAKASFSELFYEVSEDTNNTDTWRQGMISGNG